MTLDELIRALSACPDHAVRIEIGGRFPGEFASYRGYYDHLALGTGDEPQTVAQLLAAAGGAKGKTFTGYKGGDYVMDGDTPVWFSEWGDNSGIGIVGVNLAVTPLQLVTADVSHYTWP